MAIVTCRLEQEQDQALQGAAWWRAQSSDLGENQLPEKPHELEFERQSPPPPPRPPPPWWLWSPALGCSPGRGRGWWWGSGVVEPFFLCFQFTAHAASQHQSIEIFCTKKKIIYHWNIINVPVKQDTNLLLIARWHAYKIISQLFWIIINKLSAFTKRNRIKGSLLFWMHQLCNVKGIESHFAETSFRKVPALKRWWSCEWADERFCRCVSKWLQSQARIWGRKRQDDLHLKESLWVSRSVWICVLCWTTKSQAVSSSVSN